MSKHQNLAWIDLETTGLNPRQDAILEIGIIVTTSDLEPVAEKSWVVKPNRPVSISCIDPYVAKMHHKSGLWKEVMLEAKDFSGSCAEATQFIRDYGAAGSPMCGSSVHFDRAFLKESAWGIHDVFHYRNIDVSTLKNVMREHFPDAPAWEPPDEKTHRALGDLYQSIDEYQHYLDLMRSGLGG